MPATARPRRARAEARRPAMFTSAGNPKEGPRSRGRRLDRRPKFDASGPVLRSTSPRLVALVAVGTPSPSWPPSCPLAEASLHTSAPSPPTVDGQRLSSAAKAVYCCDSCTRWHTPPQSCRTRGTRHTHQPCTASQHSCRTKCRALPTRPVSSGRSVSSSIACTSTCQAAGMRAWRASHDTLE